jgi:hypothetical protein
VRTLVRTVSYAVQSELGNCTVVAPLGGGVAAAVVDVVAVCVSVRLFAIDVGVATVL